MKPEGMKTPIVKSDAWREYEALGAPCIEDLRKESQGTYVALQRSGEVHFVETRAERAARVAKELVARPQPKRHRTAIITTAAASPAGVRPEVLEAVPHGFRTRYDIFKLLLEIAREVQLDRKLATTYGSFERQLSAFSNSVAEGSEFANGHIVRVFNNKRQPTWHFSPQFTRAALIKFAATFGRLSSSERATLHAAITARYG